MHPNIMYTLLSTHENIFISFPIGQGKQPGNEEGGVWQFQRVGLL